MKKLAIYMCGMMAFFASCSQEENLMEDSRQVTFNITTGDANTRASEGAADRYVMEVYTADGTTPENIFVSGSSKTNRKEQATGTFTVPLRQDKAYKCLFWADNKATAVYDVASLKDVKLKSGKDAIAETYATVVDLAVGSAGTDQTVTLKHAVAKVVLKENSKINASSNLEVTYTPMEKLNVMAGTTTAASATVTLEKAISTAVDGSTTPQEINSFYTLAPFTEGELATLSLKLTETTTSKVTTKSVSNVPLQANYVTNVTGSFSNYLNKGFTVTTDNTWKGNADADITPKTQAKLIAGTDFYSKIPAAATKLTFKPGQASDPTDVSKKVSIDESPHNAYIIPDESTTGDAKDYLVVTTADEFLFNANCIWMFSDKSNLTEIIFDGCNTSEVTTMLSMFIRCSNLTKLDLRSFDTSKVTSMSSMFDQCSKLETVDISSFNTSAVQEISGMFHKCSSLTTLDVRHFNTSKVDNMTSMFKGCSKLTSIDVSNFNTSAVVDFVKMFQGCSGLTTLDISNFDTQKMNDIGYMFQGCSGLTTLTLGNLDVAKVTMMNYTFEGCTKLAKLDLSMLKNFPTTCNFNYLFQNLGTEVSAGTELILHKDMNLEGNPDVTDMFKGAKLKSVKCTNTLKDWITTNAATNGWNAIVTPPTPEWLTF